MKLQLLKNTFMCLLAASALGATCSYDGRRTAEKRIDCNEVVYGGQGRVEFNSGGESGCPTVLVLGPVSENAVVTNQDEKELVMLTYGKGSFGFIDRVLRDRVDGFRDVLEKGEGPSTRDRNWSSKQDMIVLPIPSLEEGKEDFFTTKTLVVDASYTYTAYYHRVSLQESSDFVPQTSLWTFIRKGYDPGITLVAYVPRARIEKDFASTLSIPSSSIFIDPDRHIMLIELDDVEESQLAAEIVDGLLSIVVTN